MHRMLEVFLASSPGVRFETLSLTVTSIKEVSRLKRLHNKAIYLTTLPNQPLDLPLQHLALAGPSYSTSSLPNKASCDISAAVTTAGTTVAAISCALSTADLRKISGSGNMGNVLEMDAYRPEVSLSHLPVDLLITIIGFLAPHDILTLRKVCISRSE
jgi:hypothetical protein